MAKQIKTIGILTSGGDAPGMNAAIRAVVRTAINKGLKVKGIQKGYNGLINEEIIDMDKRSVADIIQRGGTILYTARCMEFMTPEGQKKGAEVCKKHGIDGIVVIGGDGSMNIVSNYCRGTDVRVIGVPKTIDNDTPITEFSVGFQTACQVCTTAIDSLELTARSHSRALILGTWPSPKSREMAFYYGHPQNRFWPLLAALTAATIFGMSFMFSKMALATAAPTVLLAFRFTVAVAAMSLVIALNALVGKVRGKPLFAFSLKGKPVGKLLLLGIVQPVAYFIFENYGILYTSAAVAGTIIAAVPVCCILMDVLVLHERVTRRQVLCALGAIGGVALISVGGAVMISALGLLFLLLTMLSDTVYYGLSHDAAKRFTPFEMTYVMFVVGMAVFLAGGAVSGHTVLRRGLRTAELRQQSPDGLREFPVLQRDHGGIGAGGRALPEGGFQPVAGSWRSHHSGVRVRGQRVRRRKEIKRSPPTGGDLFICG